MDEKVKNEDPKIILTQGADGKIKAIAKANDGKLKTVEPTKEHAADFFRIDTNSNALENFYKKFVEQFGDPSHTGIYVVSVQAASKMAAFFDKIIGIDPNDKVLDPYRVTAEGKIQTPTQEKYQPLDLNNLDWKEADRLGLTGESLRDALKAMVWGHKSPGLIDVKPLIDGVEYPMKARLSLETQPNGMIKIQTHPHQEKSDFDKPFMGVVLTDADRESLQKSGHGGRVFELEPVPDGERVPALVSINKITNRLEAVPISEIQIPKILKGVELSQEQQDGLKSGQAVLIENMDKKVRPGEEPGGKITRIVQYNAANKNFDFLFTPEQRQRQAAKMGRNEDGSPKTRKVGDVWIRLTKGGVELTREQFSALCENKPVFVEGMVTPQGAHQVETTDQKGQKYNAWVWPDQDSGRIRHTSLPPDQWKAMQAKKVQPAEGFKTQVAVNNDGKTNEATKQSTEPLKKGQTQPTEKQQGYRPSANKSGKNTGHKM